jgi:hypothetical protein
MGPERRVNSATILGSAIALVLSVTCGAGGGGSTGPAGLPRSTPVGSLNATQMAALCDWANASVGGYGSIDNCDGGGSRHADSTQQSCVSKLCPWPTVGAYEDCFNAIGGDLCRTDTAPPCVSLVNQCTNPDGAATGG